MYSSYTGAVMPRHLDLAAKHGVNLLGAVTWAFEFEDQPYFDGFRDLATNGVDKPVLNVFRMLGMMTGDRARGRQSGRGDARSHARRRREGQARHARDGQRRRRIGRGAGLELSRFRQARPRRADRAARSPGLPRGRLLMQHFRVDERAQQLLRSLEEDGLAAAAHAGAVRATGSAPGNCRCLESPRWISTAGRPRPASNFDLPLHGVSLILVTW